MGIGMVWLDAGFFVTPTAWRSAWRQCLEGVWFCRCGASPRQDGLQHGLVGHVAMTVVSGQNGARKADGKGRNDRNGESQISSGPMVIRFMFISSDVWQNLHNLLWVNGLIFQVLKGEQLTTANHSWAATEVQAEAPPGILFGALRKAIKGGLQISPSSCHSRRPQYISVLQWI